eukprot:3579997-Amphidinium_carterae.1
MSLPAALLPELSRFLGIVPSMVVTKLYLTQQPWFIMGVHPHHATRDQLETDEVACGLWEVYAGLN